MEVRWSGREALDAIGVRDAKSGRLWYESHMEDVGKDESEAEMEEREPSNMELID